MRVSSLVYRQQGWYYYSSSWGTDQQTTETGTEKGADLGFILGVG